MSLALFTLRPVCHAYGLSNNELDRASRSTILGPIKRLCNFLLVDNSNFGHILHRFQHTVSHSLVDLPRWGLATADNHSDIFLLHCARSCDISFSWMYSQPVHSSTSCIHCLLGLPWCRNTSMIPSRTVSANCPALPWVMWPKYCSFRFATLPINSLSRPNSVNIESFSI